jgi:DNA-binding NtrC family response regulator
MYFTAFGEWELATRQTLLILDEDPQSVKEIETIAAAWFNVVVTRAAQRALTMLHGDPTITVFMADQNLSTTKGLTALRAAQTLRPTVRRILMAQPGQLAEVIEGLHSGAVERVVYKPIRSHDLIAAISKPDVQRASA